MVSMRNLLILITVLWTYKKMCLFLGNTHKYLRVKRPDVFNLHANGLKKKNNNSVYACVWRERLIEKEKGNDKANGTT